MLKLNDKYLREKCVPFDFTNPPVTPHEFYWEMSAVMRKNKGMGLSANQVGHNFQMFVFGDFNDKELITGVFNPKIVDHSEEMVYIEEGCLSFPGLFIKVKRPKEIRIRFTDWGGNTDTFKFTGLTARLILHEYDHLQGITFQQRANRIHLDQARSQKKKLDRLRKKNISERAKTASV